MAKVRLEVFFADANRLRQGANPGWKRLAGGLEGDQKHPPCLLARSPGGRMGPLNGLAGG
jgi:hypothetical protein